MRYDKAVDQLDRYLTIDWGTFTIYGEIGEDLFAMREVRVYENGNCLRYDRENWCDDFGELGSAKHTEKYEKHSRKEWVVKDIDKTEFESVWELAISAPNHPQQYTTDGRRWVCLDLIEK